MKEPLLLALIGLFVAVLFFRMIKAYLLGHRLKGRPQDLPTDADERLVSLVEKADSPQRARDAIHDISHIAVGVKTPAGRSAYFTAAGHLALNPLKRPNLAVGLYLRALRADPTCIEAIHKLQEILTAQRRLRRLEWTYWEVLARLDDSEVGEDAWVACWAGLAALYAGAPKTVHRADAIRKSLNAFVPDEDGEREIERISHIPKTVP